MILRLSIIRKRDRGTPGDCQLAVATKQMGISDRGRVPKNSRVFAKSRLKFGPTAAVQRRAVVRILMQASVLGGALLRGGGTAISSKLDEFRESRDMDFLRSSREGSRKLRHAVFRRGSSGLFGPDGQKTGHDGFGPVERRTDFVKSRSAGQGAAIRKEASSSRSETAARALAGQALPQWRKAVPQRMHHGRYR